MQAEGAATEETTQETAAVTEQPATAEGTPEVVDEATATEETSTPDENVSAA